MMSSTSKFIFISGGTRGIGKAIAISQAQKGCTLFLNFLRDDAAAHKVGSEAEKKGARVFLLPGNVGDSENVSFLLETVQKETDRLDALIHCAALGVFKPVHQLRVKDWD